MLTYCPQKNHLLACLPERNYRRISPSLEMVNMSLGSVVCEVNQIQDYVYFPVDCIVSLLCVMKDTDSAEIAIVGYEGMVGISQFMGGASTTSRAVVQSEGRALRMPVDSLQREFNRGGAMQHLLLMYTQALMTLMTQTAACNLHHTVEQHLSRWLLMSLDRLPQNRLMMTQGLIANMLGVRRSGATDALGKLQEAGLISHQSGVITILDRPRLERYTCECYAVVKKEYDRLLPDALPP